MEIWRLDHPEAGLLEVERGYDAEFAEQGEWPKEPKEFTPVLGDAPLYLPPPALAEESHTPHADRGRPRGS